jgi:SAM-dependent methyltransferase
VSELAADRPNYGNWVSVKLLYVSGAVTILLGGLSIIFPPLLLLALAFFACFAYFAYARQRFSSRGGDVQAKIQRLVLEHLQWDGEGEAVDIGCGNGPLTIAIAKRYPGAKVKGIDYWGGAWEYSRGVCQRNAIIEGVADRTEFQRASAATLPFDDEAFDAAVSNLVFHEVRDVRDKRELIKEALRVVKKGGVFAFQDLFLWRRVYGDVDDLLAAITSWGVERVEFSPTRDSEFIPKALKLPFMVGTIGILHGRK